MLDCVIVFIPLFCVWLSEMYCDSW